VNVTVCISCVLGSAGFSTVLAKALDEAQIIARVGEVACMSGCTRPSAVAFRADEKTAYLFGELTAADLTDLVNFARLYAASPDGEFADARPLGALRGKALARIPDRRS
jgi:predicted metal-binding protein